MEKTIMQYQKAFNGIVERMKENNSVLAVMVFGSMVTGDLWEESDIDLFVIVDKNMLEIKNIYMEEKEIPVHIKLIGKNKFVQLHGEDLRGGFIHRIFASSRLVFSKDRDITTRYDNGRYYPDLDRERWNMVYLGNVLKSVGNSRKYLYNGGIHTAYATAIRAVDEFAKLYINYSGYMISKDAMTMAMNLNDAFSVCVDELFYNKDDVETTIGKTLDYILKTVDESVSSSTNVLLNFMRQKDSLLSAEDIKSDKLFANYDINMEEILNKLWQNNIIKRETRDWKSDDGKTLFKEKVYFI